LRKAFVEALTEIAAANSQVLLLTGDLGYMALEPFRDRFPARFFNVGVAEQNLIGVASGLAEAGFIPYAYSIATFASLRPFEFIRNGPALHRLPVRIVGMGMGFEYGQAGPSHHAVEDVAVLRTLPAVVTVIPADSAQARSAIEQTWALPGPVYYSLGKDDRLSILELNGRFELGRIQTIRVGPDLAIVSMGSVTIEALAAADQLAADGIRVTLAVVSNFNPDPVDDLAALFSTVPHVITLEAQVLSGGLAALSATVIATRGIACRLWPLAITTAPDGTSGSQADRWRRHGLDRAAIVQLAKSKLLEKHSRGC
jgi:transketolase